MDRNELYAAVTAQIVEAIEAGAGTWTMPWQAIGDAAQPVNALTHKPYHGGNHLTFAMVAVGRGWSGHWATYKQWQQLGAQVRKGEKATHGVKWSSIEHTDKVTGQTETRMVPFTFTVFAAEQVDGWTIPERAERDTVEAIDAAELFFAALGADVRHGGNKAAYNPTGDFIVLPDRDQFGSSVAYYATRAHESAHWTGHASRLARDLTGRFGSDSYAAEELVAELSAAFTCSALGISTTPRPDHAAYLTSWLRVLKADPSALFTVAAKAQAASDFLAELASTAVPALAA